MEGGVIEKQIKSLMTREWPSGNYDRVHNTEQCCVRFALVYDLIITMLEKYVVVTPTKGKSWAENDSYFNTKYLQILTSEGKWVGNNVYLSFCKCNFFKYWIYFIVCLAATRYRRAWKVQYLSVIKIFESHFKLLLFRWAVGGFISWGSSQQAGIFLYLLN